jgi:hypothetical protein
MTKRQLQTLRKLCSEPGLPKWHYIGLRELPDDCYVIRPNGPALFSSTAHPTAKGRAILAAESAA